MLTNKQKSDALSHVTSVASSHSHSEQHKHSLIDFDYLNAGFVYTDSWGTEHTFHLCIDKQDKLNILYVNNPLVGDMMEESDSPTAISLIVDYGKDWGEYVKDTIDDYCYRDDPVQCGNEKPFSLVSK